MLTIIALQWTLVREDKRRLHHQPTLQQQLCRKSVPQPRAWVHSQMNCLQQKLPLWAAVWIVLKCSKCFTQRSSGSFCVWRKVCLPRSRRTTLTHFSLHSFNVQSRRRIRFPRGSPGSLNAFSRYSYQVWVWLSYSNFWKNPVNRNWNMQLLVS